VASANCAIYVGAKPTFVDIDPHTLNLDPRAVTGDVDALVAVHFAGLPIDLAALENRPRIVIEDAAHALGATTPNGPVGNCALSDMCCFSFHPVKAITTGEGGAVTTNDEALADRLRRFRSHGIRARPDLGGWAYEVVEEGYNYRLTDIQAALGTSQLNKLERFVRRRVELAERYRALLADANLTLPPAPPAGWCHPYHLFAIRVQDRRFVFDGLRAAGIGAQVHYVPIHRHPVIARLGEWTLPETEAACSTLLSLPIFPRLSEQQQDTVVEVLRTLV
jgi:dTDP-4-amino-4,6-dideoxygalactose transaminase